MIIRTFDPATLAVKDTISELSSVIFTSRFYKGGSFEIHAQKGFELNDIIAFKAHGKIHSGIVMSITEDETERVITGIDLKGFFAYRQLNGATYSGTPAEILEAMATEQLASGDKALPSITITTSGISGDSTTYTAEDSSMSEAVDSFGVLHELGTELSFDLQGLTFSVLKGVDRSNAVEFGRNNRTLESYELKNDLFGTYNVGYSRDEDEAVISVGEAAGFLRREGYSSKDIDEYLAEKAPISTLRGEANEKYTIGVDYNLGDYVTVNAGGFSTVKQITEIKEVYEPNRVLIIPIMGTEKENPLKKIMKG